MKKRKGLLASLLAVVIAFSLPYTNVLATTGELPDEPSQSQEQPVFSEPAQSSEAGGNTPVIADPTPSGQASSAPASSAVVSRPSSSSQMVSSKPQTVVPPKTSSQTSSGTVIGGGTESSSGLESSSSSPSSLGISLPPAGEVSEVDNLIGSSVEVKTQKSMNLWGIVSWALIGIGILIVVVVLLSTLRRPPPGGGPGRKRYRRRPYASNKKRLLNDKYYR